MMFSAWRASISPRRTARLAGSYRRRRTRPRPSLMETRIRPLSQRPDLLIGVESTDANIGTKEVRWAYAGNHPPTHARQRPHGGRAPQPDDSNACRQGDGAWRRDVRYPRESG